MNKEERIDRVIHLLRQGWTQGEWCNNWYDDQCHLHIVYCVEGAIRATASASGGLDGDWLWNDAMKKCQEMYGRPLVTFNDQPTTKVDDVIAIFEKVRADLLE